MKKIIFLSLLTVFAVALFFACSSSPEEKGAAETEPAEVNAAHQAAIDEPDSVFTVVDVMPVFSGGEKELLKYIADKVVYPEEAKKAGTEGRPIVRFCVTGTGEVTSVSIIKGASPELDAEAVRVIGNLPAFESPAYKDGKPVSVWYAVPISFRLK